LNIIVKENENWRREVKVTPSTFPTLPNATIQEETSQYVIVEKTLTPMESN